MCNILQTFRALMQFDNGWEMLFQRLFFRGTNMQVHRVAGKEMVVDRRTCDIGSIRGLLAGDMYRRFMPLMCLNGPVKVLDIGANAGGFPLLLSACGVTIARLVCVEMNPNTYERLRFNIRTNYADESEVINAAVCPARGKLTVNLGKGSTNDNIYAGTPIGVGATKSYTIDTLSLDDVAEKLGDGLIDICKIDIEGAEYEVLCRADSRNSSLSRMKYLIIEIHHQRQSEEIFAVLAGRGLLPEPPSVPKDGTFLFRNTAAMHQAVSL